MTKIQLIRSFNCMVIQERGCSYGGCAYTKSQKNIISTWGGRLERIYKTIVLVICRFAGDEKKKIQTILTYVMATDRLDDDDFVISV